MGRPIRITTHSALLTPFAQGASILHHSQPLNTSQSVNRKYSLLQIPKSKSTTRPIRLVPDSLAEKHLSTLDNAQRNLEQKDVSLPNPVLIKRIQATLAQLSTKGISPAYSMSRSLSLNLFEQNRPNQKLNANRIFIDGTHMGSICQNPQKGQIKYYVDWWFNSPPANIISISSDCTLCSLWDPREQGLFESQILGPYKIITESGEVSHVGDGVELNPIQMRIMNRKTQQQVNIPVYDLQGWLPGKGLSQPTLDRLSTIVSDQLEEANTQTGERLVIESKQGAGRALNLFAATVMQIVPRNLSLQHILKEIGRFRNGMQTLTSDQLIGLIELAKEQQRPVLDKTYPKLTPIPE